MNFRVVFKTADKGVEFYSARKRSGILKTAYFFAVRRQIGTAVYIITMLASDIVLILVPCLANVVMRFDQLGCATWVYIYYIFNILDLSWVFHNPHPQVTSSLR